MNAVAIVTSVALPPSPRQGESLNHFLVREQGHADKLFRLDQQEDAVACLVSRGINRATLFVVADREGGRSSSRWFHTGFRWLRWSDE